MQIPLGFLEQRKNDVKWQPGDHRSVAQFTSVDQLVQPRGLRWKPKVDISVICEEHMSRLGVTKRCVEEFEAFDSHFKVTASIDRSLRELHHDVFSAWEHDLQRYTSQNGFSVVFDQPDLVSTW